MSHLGWRIRVQKSRGTSEGSYLALSTLEMHSSIEGTQVCVGGTAVASSTSSGGNPPDVLFDGDPSTGWHNSNTDNYPWCGYIFAAPIDIVEMKFLQTVPFTDGNAILNPLFVDVTDDATNWYLYGQVLNGGVTLNPSTAPVVPISATTNVAENHYFNSAGFLSKYFSSRSIIAFRKQMNETQPYGFGMPVLGSSFLKGAVEGEWSFVWSGKGTISGVTQVLENDFGPKIVRLYVRHSGQLVAETRSDASGNYSFSGLNPNLEYYVLGVDQTRQYNITGQDQVSLMSNP